MLIGMLALVKYGISKIQDDRHGHHLNAAKMQYLGKG